MIKTVILSPAKLKNMICINGWIINCFSISRVCMVSGLVQCISKNTDNTHTNIFCYIITPLWKLFLKDRMRTWKMITCNQRKYASLHSFTQQGHKTYSQNNMFYMLQSRHDHTDSLKLKVNKSNKQVNHSTILIPQSLNFSVLITFL